MSKLAGLLVDFGCRFAVVTGGADGAVYTDGRRTFTAPGFSVEAYDTTGAGDVFHGGFIYGLLQGWSPERSVRFANAAAALSCRKLSGRGGIPARVEVESFLSEKEGVPPSVG